MCWNPTVIGLTWSNPTTYQNRKDTPNSFNNNVLLLGGFENFIQTVHRLDNNVLLGTSKRGFHVQRDLFLFINKFL